MSAESGASSSSQDAAAPLIVLRRSGEDAASQERCPAQVLRRCRGDSVFGDRLRGVGREPCRCDGLRCDRGAHVVAAAEHASVRAAGGFATEAAVLVVRARASRSVLARPAGRGLRACARCRRTAGGPRMMLTIRSMAAGGIRLLYYRLYRLYSSTTDKGLRLLLMPLGLPVGVGMRQWPK